MQRSRTVLFLASAALLGVGAAYGQSSPDASATQAPVVFAGGHDTEGRDRGRPVILVAGALGVPPEVFREAFSHVHPAPAGTEPDPQQVSANKAALMAALRPYGITDERLNIVSNYYRYVRSRGESWPTKTATGYAVVRNGMVEKYVVTSGGSGYSSPPTISVPSIPGATGKAQITFGKDFDKNGSVAAIVTAPDKGK